MSCQELLMQMGYDCREVAGRTVAVSTPFTFPDGEVIGFYVREDRGDRVIFHDNADTLAHLVAMGIHFPNRMGEWRTIKNILAAWDLKLEESGIITGSAPGKLQPKLVTSYISALLAIADFEREQFGLSEEQADFIAQVEFYLKAWKPHAMFEKAPSVKGHSGKDYRFHFAFDGQLVEAARPHGSRTGSILRKSVDVKNAADRDVLVVMDDREEPERAKQETDILTTVVRVMPFTTLIRHSEGGAVQ